MRNASYRGGQFRRGASTLPSASFVPRCCDHVQWPHWQVVHARLRWLLCRKTGALRSTVPHRTALPPALPHHTRCTALRRERLTVAAERTTRFVRCVKVFSLISWDYKHSLRTLKEGSEEYKAALQEVNQRSAVKFVELCR